MLHLSYNWYLLQQSNFLRAGRLKMATESLFGKKMKWNPIKTFSFWSEGKNYSFWVSSKHFCSFFVLRVVSKIRWKWKDEIFNIGWCVLWPNLKMGPNHCVVSLWFQMIVTFLLRLWTDRWLTDRFIIQKGCCKHIRKWNIWAQDFTSRFHLIFWAFFWFTLVLCWLLIFN